MLAKTPHPPFGHPLPQGARAMGGDLASRRYIASLSVLRLLALRQFRKLLIPSTP